jgi:hypothetical protein
VGERPVLTALRFEEFLELVGVFDAQRVCFLTGSSKRA